MKRIFFFALFFITSCSVASETVTDEVTLLSYKLQLTSNNGKCYLLVGKTKIQLTPTPPCHFLRDSNKDPQHYAYPDAGVEATLIVSGSPISSAIRKEWGISENLVCGFQSQGVLIKNGEVTATDKTLDQSVQCRDMGSDEKNFWYFSH